MLCATVRQRKIYVKKPETVIQNGIGVDEIHLEMDDEWAAMTAIVCVLTLRYQAEQDKLGEDGEPETDEDGNPIKETVTKEEVRAVNHTFGKPLPVPSACLAHTGLLSLNCTGYVGEEKRMTTMLADSYWNVVQNGPMDGPQFDEDVDLSVAELARIATAKAEAAATNANDTAAAVKKAMENGEFDGASATVKIGTVKEGAAPSVTNSGSDTDVVLDFVLPRGENGRGVLSMTAAGNVITVRYTDGTSQNFAIQAPGASSWNDLKDKPDVITGLGYQEETGVLSVFYNNSFFPGGTIQILGTDAVKSLVKEYVDDEILGGAW